MTELVYGYDESDKIPRGDGSSGFAGVSAIDGLIAAVVAGRAALQPTGWPPSIFGGRMPVTPPAPPQTAGRQHHHPTPRRGDRARY